jgi:hypothetical protein
MSVRLVQLENAISIRLSEHGLFLLCDGHRACLDGLVSIGLHGVFPPV